MHEFLFIRIANQFGNNSKKFGRIIPGYQPEKVELRGYDSYTVTLGDKLRGERATLGKTLDDIQKETRLRIEFLLGIENAGAVIA